MSGWLEGKTRLGVRDLWVSLFRAGVWGGFQDAARRPIRLPEGNVGDVIKAFPVRTFEGEKPRRLRLYFDTGSPYTFIKRSACRGFRAVYDLPKPKGFGGLGDGRFFAAQGAFLEVRLLGIWCSHAAYVVPDAVLTEDEDLLVGHDFMQKFDVSIDSRRKDVVLRRASLKGAQIVRRAPASGNRDLPLEPVKP